MEKIKNYINGKLVESSSGNYIDNYNPASGKVYSLVPDSNEDDINAAVLAANTAFQSWSKTSKKYRSDLLMRLASKIEDYSEELIIAESRDNGKPESLARLVDIPRASENFRFFFFQFSVFRFAREDFLFQTQQQKEKRKERDIFLIRK